MPHPLRGCASIVGVADAASPTGSLGRSPRELEVAMLREALDDAGLSLRDVDGVFVAGMGMMPALELAEYLGLQPRYTDSTMTGGSSFEVLVEHAAAAIALGLCDVAVSVYAATPRTHHGGRNLQPRSGGDHRRRDGDQHDRRRAAIPRL